MHLTALILLSVCLVLKTLLSRKWFISVLYDWKPVSQFMETVVIQLDMSWNFSYRLKAVVIFIKQRISYSNNFGACTWIETSVFSRPLNATDSLSFVDHAIMHIKTRREVHEGVRFLRGQSHGRRLFFSRSKPNREGFVQCIQYIR